MKRDVVRSRIEVVEPGQADSLLLGNGDGDKRIVRYKVHPKGTRAPRDFHADASQPNNAQGLGAQFRALQRLLFPLARVHKRVGAG